MGWDVGFYTLTILAGLMSFISGSLSQAPNDPRMYMAAASKQVGGSSTTPFSNVVDLRPVELPASQESTSRQFFLPRNGWFFPPAPVDEPESEDEDAYSNDDIYDRGWTNFKRAVARSAAGRPDWSSARRSLVARNAPASTSNRTPQNYNFFRLIG